MNNKFLNFIKPYLDYIDSGKLYRQPFSWLYGLIGILNLLGPLLILFQAFDSGLFSTPAKYVAAFSLIWFAIAFAGWVSFQLWWDRKNRVASSSTEEDEFTATPVYCHLIQTVGEWAGTWIAIVGTIIALITTIFLGEEGARLLDRIGLGFIETSVFFIILSPLYGFLLIISSRFISEQFKALAAIANNTKRE